jgi:hypothetical protein
LAETYPAAIERLRAMGHDFDKASRQGDAHSVWIDPHTDEIVIAADRRISDTAAAIDAAKLTWMPWVNALPEVMQSLGGFPSALASFPRRPTRANLGLPQYNFPSLQRGSTSFLDDDHG